MAVRARTIKAKEPPKYITTPIGGAVLVALGWSFYAATRPSGIEALPAPTLDPIEINIEEPSILENSRAWLSGTFSRAGASISNIELPRFKLPELNFFKAEADPNPAIQKPVVIELPSAPPRADLPVMGDMSRVMYRVPDDMNDPMEKFSVFHRVPVSIAANILGSESGFRNSAVSASGALGIGQFVESTRNEEFYKNRNLYSQEVRDIITANIEEYNAAESGKKAILRYRIKEGGSQKAIDDLAFNPEVSLGAAFGFMNFSIKEGSRRFFEKLGDRIDAMEKRGADKARLDEMRAHLQRPLTTADLKIFYVLGVAGGADLLEALADPVKRADNHAAKDYTRRRTVRNNEALFYKDFPDNKKPRNIVEFYTHIESIVGDEPIPEELVSTRPQTRGQLLANYDLGLN